MRGNRGSWGCSTSTSTTSRRRRSYSTGPWSRNRREAPGPDRNVSHLSRKNCSQCHRSRIDPFVVTRKEQRMKERIVYAVLVVSLILNAVLFACGKDAEGFAEPVQFNE